MNTPPFRIDIPFTVWTYPLSYAQYGRIWQNICRIYTYPKKICQKILKFENFKNMSSQTRGYPHTHPGFENNLLCNIYAKYAQSAKYVYLNYVIFVVYMQNMQICKICTVSHSGWQPRLRWNAVSCSVAVDMFRRFTAYKLDRVFSGSA